MILGRPGEGYLRSPLRSLLLRVSNVPHSCFVGLFLRLIAVHDNEQDETPLNKREWRHVCSVQALMDSSSM